MKIAALEKSLEPVFWETVASDSPHYFYFAFDWKYNREQTEILLALENNKIHGMMLIYKGEIVQLRGKPEAAKALLERLDLEKIEILAPKEHKPYIIKKYKPTTAHEMMIMVLRRGEEKPQVRHPVVALGFSEAKRIAALMREADRELWGNVSSRRIVEGMNRGAKWFGVKVSGELVSAASGWVTEWGGLIGIVATSKQHRNRGYATSVASTLVKWLLTAHPLVMIFVRSSNAPAVHVYEKVGFKQYRKYFFMRGKKLHHSIANL